MILVRTALFVTLAATGAAISTSQASEFNQPWTDGASSIILEPFQKNKLDWSKIINDKKIAGVIHKASEGFSSDSEYASRRKFAREHGYLWGSYHLLTTADPKKQIGHYLTTVGDHNDETYALDVECLATTTDCQYASHKVSMDQVEQAIIAFKEATGHFPLIYANDSVAKSLAARWGKASKFSGIRLWYARFKNEITDFPIGQWPSYTLWQFSSEINCKSQTNCPYRIPGTPLDIDLNVYNGSIDDLKAKWPLNR